VISIDHAAHGIPHICAVDAEHEALIAIDTLEVLKGSLPRPVLRRVLVWAALHREELVANWERRGRESMLKIDPFPY
jgi:hypothetical protein